MTPLLARTLERAGISATAVNVPVELACGGLRGALQPVLVWSHVDVNFTLAWIPAPRTVLGSRACPTWQSSTLRLVLVMHGSCARACLRVRVLGIWETLHCSDGEARPKHTGVAQGAGGAVNGGRWAGDCHPLHALLRSVEGVL